VTYEPLHHKYRPQIFADLVGQDAIAITLSNAIRTERIAPAYLFSGPRGTGKTSSARILAKSLNCLQSDRPTEQPCGVCEVCRAIAHGSALDVIEIDAASNTGVDNIRELIERAQFAPVQCRYKIYVLDEVHMLSTAAFNALLKTLEEPPNHVVFILATTDPQRVLPTIISRCQRFDFRRIALEAMVSHLRAIAAQENINIAEDALQLLAQIAQGGLRDAESLLDQLSLLPDQITIKRVWDLVGMVPEQDLMALLVAIAANNPEVVLDRARYLMDRGYEPLTLLQNLAGFYRDLLIAKTAPTRPDLVTLTLPTWTKLCDFAQKLDVSGILVGQQHLRSCEVQVKNTTQPRLWLEVALLGLLPSSSNHQPVGLDFNPNCAAVSKMPMSSGQEFGEASSRAARSATPTTTLHEQQPETSREPLQLEQSVTVTTSHLPEVKQPAHSDSLSTSVSTNGTSQNREAQPAQVEAIASSPQVSTTVEVPEPSNQPPPSQPVTRGTPRNGSGSTATNPASPTDAVIEQPHLNQVWQTVVAQLHPPGTQALLHQQGRLLAFDGQVARVGIRSQPLFKMAQARLPNVEAAFLKAFNHPVKVNLEVAAIEPRPTLPHEQPTPNAPSELASFSQAVEPTPRNTTQLPAPQPTQPPQPSTENFPQAFSPPEAQASAWKEDDEVTRAAKSLAQFFNGEIVSQENELVPGSTTPNDNLYPPGQSTDSTEDDCSQLDDGEEIPF
jgi:DNA polymerase-3 subunit gamma/tau